MAACSPGRGVPEPLRSGADEHAGVCDSAAPRGHSVSGSARSRSQEESVARLDGAGPRLALGNSSSGEPASVCTQAFLRAGPLSAGKLPPGRSFWKPH